VRQFGVFRATQKKEELEWQFIIFSKTFFDKSININTKRKFIGVFRKGIITP
jgi:hypothetical protein